MNNTTRRDKIAKELSEYTVFKYEILNRQYKVSELINNEIKANIQAYKNLSEECETAQDYKELLFTSIADIRSLSDMMCDSLDEIRVFNNDYILNDRKKESDKISPYSYEFSKRMLENK